MKWTTFIGCKSCAPKWWKAWQPDWGLRSYCIILTTSRSTTKRKIARDKRHHACVSESNFNVSSSLRFPKTSIGKTKVQCNHCKFNEFKRSRKKKKKTILNSFNLKNHYYEAPLILDNMKLICKDVLKQSKSNKAFLLSACNALEMCTTKTP